MDNKFQDHQGIWKFLILIGEITIEQSKRKWPYPGPKYLKYHTEFFAIDEQLDLVTESISIWLVNSWIE